MFTVPAGRSHPLVLRTFRSTTGSWTCKYSRQDTPTDRKKEKRKSQNQSQDCQRTSLITPPGAHSQWQSGVPEPRPVPRGMLMRSPPSRARSLLRLKVPRRRRTCGRSRSTCCSSSVSSRSNTSSSHCASRCSRRRSCSAWDRCSRAARVSSSSRLSSSCAPDSEASGVSWASTNPDLPPQFCAPSPHSSHLFLGSQLVKEALNLTFPALLHGMEGVPRHLPQDLRL